VSAKRILLAPGASGNPAQLARHRAGLRQRGYEADIVALPKGTAERAMPIYRAAVGPDAAGIVIGGQSFGGRVATLIAPEIEPAAVVCFSYPLHAPGRQEAWADRTAHWPRIGCPVLLLSGEADPFARIDLLHHAVEQLPRATLVTYPGLGHSLAAVLDRALDEVDAFLAANT
jgi:predicted alpha/beta-hydrolase family hydrolase